MDKYPINIVLEDIRSALNVGAIFRTCDAGNIEKLWLTGITPYPPHNRIPKTALGSIEYVNWEQTKDTEAILKNFKTQNKKVYSIEITDNSKDIFNTEIEFPAVFILGNEINGVSKSSMQLSDAVIHIPMYGRKESLNVATTCGIVIYEAIRRFLLKNDHPSGEINNKI
jgi:23S rRNA (guanosine2251-2'-O)-methyltransferase